MDNAASKRSYFTKLPKLNFEYVVAIFSQYVPINNSTAVFVAWEVCFNIQRSLKALALILETEEQLKYKKSTSILFTIISTWYDIRFKLCT